MATGGATPDSLGLDVLADHDHGVLLRGAAGHRAARLQGHPRPGLWGASLASLGDPNAVEDDTEAKALGLDRTFRLLLLGHQSIILLRQA